MSECCDTVAVALEEMNFIVFRKGSIPVLLQIITVNDDGTDGPPFDLTGFTDIQMVLFDPANPSTILGTWDTSNYLTIDPPNGKIQIEVPKSVVSGYPWNVAQYYLVVTDLNGDVIGLTGGTISLTLNPLLCTGQGGI